MDQLLGCRIFQKSVRTEEYIIHFFVYPILFLIFYFYFSFFFAFLMTAVIDLSSPSPPQLNAPLFGRVYSETVWNSTLDPPSSPIIKLCKTFRINRDNRFYRRIIIIRWIKQNCNIQQLTSTITTKPRMLKWK